MKKHAGFTLMELMVVIAIIGILSAITIPNAISWRNNAQVNSAARDVYSNLQFARSMAAKENMRCRVVFENGGYTIALLDPISGNVARHLKTVSFSSYGAVEFKSAKFPDAANPGITFRPTGFPFNAAGNLSGGIVELHGATNKEIELTAAGNVRIRDI